MEKPDPTCPTCRQPAKFLREVNAVVDFWECEATHVFMVEKKLPPKLSAAAAAREAAKDALAQAAATATATAEAPPEPKAPAS